MPPKKLKQDSTATVTTAVDYPVSKKPVIVDRYDYQKVKQTLDEASEKYFIQVIQQPADYTFVDWRIGVSIVAVVLACVAQFYDWVFPAYAFPKNKPILAFCVVGYMICQAVLQFIASFRQKNIVYRSKVGVNGGRIIASSHMAKYSDIYQLKIKDTSDNTQLTMERSMTRWWSEANVFDEKAFWMDIDEVIDAKNK